MNKFYEDDIKKGKSRYEPKRNMSTELRYFELLPWTQQPVPGQDNIILLAVARNSGDHYIALRDTETRKEYVEKVLLTPSGEGIKIAPIKIEDDLEWNSAFEFFVKMGVIQTRKSSWRWAWRKESAKKELPL